jgi:hypothetical protein
VAAAQHPERWTQCAGQILHQYTLHFVADIRVILQHSRTRHLRKYS